MNVERRTLNVEVFGREVGTSKFDVERSKFDVRQGPSAAGRIVAETTSC